MATFALGTLLKVGIVLVATGATVSGPFLLKSKGSSIKKSPQNIKADKDSSARSVKSEDLGSVNSETPFNSKRYLNEDEGHSTNPTSESSEESDSYISSKSHESADGISGVSQLETNSSTETHPKDLDRSALRAEINPQSPSNENKLPKVSEIVEDLYNGDSEQITRSIENIDIHLGTLSSDPSGDREKDLEKVIVVKSENEEDSFSSINLSDKEVSSSLLVNPFEELSSKDPKYCKIVLRSEDQNNEILLCWDTGRENPFKKSNEFFERQSEYIYGRDYFSGTWFLRNKAKKNLQQFIYLISEEPINSFIKDVSKLDWENTRWRVIRHGGIGYQQYAEEFGDYFYLDTQTKDFKLPTFPYGALYEMSRGGVRWGVGDRHARALIHPSAFLGTEISEFRRGGKEMFSLIPADQISKLNTEADFQLVLKDNNKFWNAGGAHLIDFELAHLSDLELRTAEYREDALIKKKDFEKKYKKLLTKDPRIFDFADFSCSASGESPFRKEILECSQWFN